MYLHRVTSLKIKEIDWIAGLKVVFLIAILFVDGWYIYSSRKV